MREHHETELPAQLAATARDNPLRCTGVKHVDDAGARGPSLAQGGVGNATGSRFTCDASDSAAVRIVSGRMHDIDGGTDDDRYR